MARYRHLDLSHVAELASRYGIEATAFEPMSGGWNNSNFKISSSSGEYVLKIFDNGAFEPVEGLADLLAHLAESGFATTPVSPLEEGGFVTRFEGKPVLIKGFVEGQVIEKLNLKQIEEAGAALAKLHAVPPPRCLNQKHVYEDYIYPDVLKRHGEPFTVWFSERKSEFDQLMATSSLPAGLAHGDLFADNILYSQSHLSAIIDFECACHYPFIADIGMATVGLACRGSRLDPAQARALLTGYQSIRPLREDEKNALRTSMIWGAAGTACWRYRRFRLVSFDPRHCDRYLELKELADFLRAISDEELRATCFDPAPELSTLNTNI